MGWFHNIVTTLALLTVGTITVYWQVGWLNDMSIHFVGEIEISDSDDARHENCCISTTSVGPLAHTKLELTSLHIQQVDARVRPIYEAHVALFANTPEWSPLIATFIPRCCIQPAQPYYCTGETADYYTMAWAPDHPKDYLGGFIYKWHCKTPHRPGFPLEHTMGRIEFQSWPDHYHGYFSKPTSYRAIRLAAHLSQLTYTCMAENGVLHWYREKRWNIWPTRQYTVRYVTRSDEVD